ncbi:UNVERIFIED_ORG: lytic transglycosylase domain-containing protein (plasmid) [Roseateles sp. XES5]|nr:lytic transglycosylase domain-containing protein [Roseateles sp. XES5]
MLHARRRSDRGRLALLVAGGLFFGTSPDTAIAQIEWRAPPCTYSMTTSTGTLCVREASFNRDICGALARFAGENDLPPDFFARLIWAESRFRPDAISPKGAEGIAQFIPSTARLRGLSNSFDALEALKESAEYLDDLRNRFGNIGLAAAAYNAGEGGLRTFLKTGSLPQETRNYVLDITAHAAEDWRDDPPVAVDLRLDGQKSFEDACIALADTRRLKGLEFEVEGAWAPWGAQLAGHFQKSVAVRLFLSTVRSLPAPLNKEKPLIQKERNPAFGTRLRYTARIGRQTRQEAEAVCREVRSRGGACVVFRNRP